MSILTPPAIAASKYRSDSARRNSFARGLPFVASRCSGGYAPLTNRAACQSNGTDMQAMHRLAHQFPHACRDIRLVFGNYNYDAVGASTITLKVGFEYSGINYPVRFNGQDSVAIPPGSFVVSDPVPVEITAGTYGFERTWLTVANSGDKWPFGRVYNSGTPTFDGFVSGASASDSSRSTGTISGGGGSAGYAAAGIIGLTAGDIPSIGILGDSIFSGVGDFTFIEAGFVERALSGLHGYTNLSRHAERAQDVIGGGSTGRQPQQQKLPLVSGCTHVFAGHPTNDVAGGNLASVKSNVITFWNYLLARGVKAMAYTIPPRTTSTDGWATRAGQTVLSSESVRTGYNDWLRDGAPILAGGTAAAAIDSNAVGTLRIGDTGHPIAAYWECADVLETARNSGIWRTQAEGTGTTASGSNQITGVAASFGAFAVGQNIAGAGIPANTEITNVSGTTITISTNATASATVTIGAHLTADGIHPNKSAYVIGAADLATDLPAFLV